MHIQPYLFLEGRCEEAIAFYREALGAELRMMMRYGDSPDPSAARPGLEDKIMHATLKIGETMLFLSDGRCGGDPAVFQGFALSIAPDSDDEATRMFHALNEGGRTMMPLGPTFFASTFGMTTDRFGVLWMVIVERQG